MNYRIKDISELTGLSPHTLRYYEKEGLIEDLKRDENGIRVYTDFDLEIVRSIECLKSAGLSLKEIKKHLDLFKQGNKTYENRAELFRVQREKIAKKMDELQKQLDITEYKIWYYEHMEELGNEEDPMNCQKMRALYDKEVESVNFSL